MGIFIRFFLYALLLLPAFRVGAQALDAAYLQSNFQLHITKTSGPITLDGEFNEPVWKEAESAGSFHKKYPTWARPRKKQTFRYVTTVNSSTSLLQPGILEKP